MGLHENMKSLLNNRWLVFVASMWVQSCSGIGYMFGSISPVIKKNMGYTQRQIAMLGVAKDIGDAIGFVAGSLCEVLCVCIFVGTNGETYFNTGALVSGVQNFPKSRGPVVGILKGFAGLSGAILTQVYTIFNFPDQASVIFVVAVGPTIVITSVMFIIRPVGGHRQARRSDSTSFYFLYGVCVVLASLVASALSPLRAKIVHLQPGTIWFEEFGGIIKLSSNMQAPRWFFNPFCGNASVILMNYEAKKQRIIVRFVEYDCCLQDQKSLCTTLRELTNLKLRQVHTKLLCGIRTLIYHWGSVQYKMVKLMEP
ncbi:nuclear fusion defective 4-like protein [Tanacetum coccineum]